MDWLEPRQPNACNRKTCGQTLSAIALGMNYGPDHNPMENLERTAGNISVYARGRDYHMR